MFSQQCLGLSQLQQTYRTGIRSLPHWSLGWLRGCHNPFELSCKGFRKRKSPRWKMGGTQGSMGLQLACTRTRKFLRLSLGEHCCQHICWRRGRCKHMRANPTFRQQCTQAVRRKQTWMRCSRAGGIQDLSIRSLAIVHRIQKCSLRWSHCSCRKIGH